MSIVIINAMDIANTYDTLETYFKVGEKENLYSEESRRPKRRGLF